MTKHTNLNNCGYKWYEKVNQISEVCIQQDLDKIQREDSSIEIFIMW